MEMRLGMCDQLTHLISQTKVVVGSAYRRLAVKRWPRFDCRIAAQPDYDITCHSNTSQSQKYSCTSNGPDRPQKTNVESKNEDGKWLCGIKIRKQN